MKSKIIRVVFCLSVLLEYTLVLALKSKILLKNEDGVVSYIKYPDINGNNISKEVNKENIKEIYNEFIDKDMTVVAVKKSIVGTYKVFGFRIPYEILTLCVKNEETEKHKFYILDRYGKKGKIPNKLSTVVRITYFGSGKKCLEWPDEKIVNFEGQYLSYFIKPKSKKFGDFLFASLIYALLEPLYRPLASNNNSFATGLFNEIATIENTKSSYELSYDHRKIFKQIFKNMAELKKTYSIENK